MNFMEVNLIKPWEFYYGWVFLEFLLLDLHTYESWILTDHISGFPIPALIPLEISICESLFW